MAEPSQMSVLVITDSTATLPEDVADELGIAVVPIRVLVGDRSHRDGEFTHEELLEATERVTTSGPSPQDFLDVIESRGSEDGVIILTLAHDLAESTLLSAQVAAAAASVPVMVLDTTTTAGAQGLVCLAAARAAGAGASFEEVETEARWVIQKVRLVAVLPSLDHLARSGHVPEAVAWAGRWVGLHLLVDIRRGKVRPLKPALSARAAREQILEAWRSSRPNGPARLHIAGLHALEPEGAEELVKRAGEETRPEEVFVGSFGTAMVIHSGPGVVGLAWWWDESGGGGPAQARAGEMRP